MRSCEILSVGTELLLGEIVDTNAPFLSRELAALGIPVLYRGTVGDNAQRLGEEVRRALRRSDLVILTGGLGPTADDLTKEVCAAQMGFSLVRDDRAQAQIRDFFARRGSEMPASNLKQADVPDGGTVFYNAHGTAPGMAMERDGKCLILLPGPPHEMQAMFRESVLPFLAAKDMGVIASHTVRTMGIGESALAEQVSDLLEGSNPTVAPYAKMGEALLRVTARAQTDADAQALMQPVLAEIRNRLQPYIYGIDTDSIQQAVVYALAEKKLHIATAESCTAGYIAGRIAQVPGASAVFDWGVVTYANTVKQNLLGVQAQTLKTYGAVSAETAREMAAGALERSGADIAVAVTGVAGPGGTEQKPAGLSYIGVADRRGVEVTRFETGRDDREYNRNVTASRALYLAWRRIQNIGEDK